MAHRPRLVEEGKPIFTSGATYTGSDNVQRNRISREESCRDHDDEEEYLHHLETLESEYQKTINKKQRNSQSYGYGEPHRQNQPQISSLQRHLKMKPKTYHAPCARDGIRTPDCPIASNKKKKYKLVKKFEIQCNDISRGSKIRTNLAQHVNAYKTGQTQQFHSPLESIAQSTVGAETNMAANHINMYTKKSLSENIQSMTADCDLMELEETYEHGHENYGDNDDHENGWNSNEYFDENTSVVQPERMEIDELHLQRLPMVVIDGANVAYAYAQATATGSSNDRSNWTRGSSGSIEPNVLGIQIASSYFLSAGCRVQVVIPAYWMRRKPKYGDKSEGELEGKDIQMQIMNKLKEQKLLFCSPPTDDDDAYCIAIARRIDARSRNKKQDITMPTVTSLQQSSTSTTDDLTTMEGGFILSNDLFRDAIARDKSGDLRLWLKGSSQSEFTSGEDKRHDKSSSAVTTSRLISYSFGDFGSMNGYGDEQLDFLPNPRHDLVSMIERFKRTHENYVHDDL